MTEFKCYNGKEYVFAIKYLAEQYNISFVYVEKLLPRNWEFPIIVFYRKDVVISSCETPYIGWYNSKFEKSNVINIKNIMRNLKLKRIHEK